MSFPDFFAPISDMTRPQTSTWHQLSELEPSLVRLGGHTKAFHSWLVGGKSWREAEHTSEKVFSRSRQASGGIVVTAKASPRHAFPLPPKCPLCEPMKSGWVLSIGRAG